MGEEDLIGLASIVVLGIGAQWLAWRLNLPAILLLLLAGFLAGPVTGLIDPDHLLGETLFPVVSISVGIILFEGGLTLRLAEIKGAQHVLARLITVGALITWIIAVAGAHYIVGLDFSLALLLGAVFVVSGPTVVLPLLNFVRPKGQIGPILRWEGILIDPIGATLAVLVFEATRTEQLEGSSAPAIGAGMLQTALVGGGIGLIAGLFMVEVIRRHWVPEHLQNPFAVMLVVGAFAAANGLQPEAGLLTTTLMGVLVANQRSFPVKHLLQFKEDIGVLLLSGLFVLLAARLDLESVSSLSIRAVLFMALLILVARPLAVLASTARSHLTWRERIVLAWLAPRGIVAVSVASLFALELTEAGRDGADQLVPLTFLVVVGTVAIYGLTISFVASRLGLAHSAPQGILIAGANPFARSVARALRSGGRDVLLVDTNRDQVRAARAEGLPTVFASILSEQLLDEVDLGGIGRLLALTPNDEVNSLAALRFADVFGRAHVFQLPLHKDHRSRTGISLEQHGRLLFEEGVTWSYLAERCGSGAAVKSIPLSKQFGYADFRAQYGNEAVPLFVLSSTGDLVIVTAGSLEVVRPGDTLLALVDSSDADTAHGTGNQNEPTPLAASSEDLSSR